jgi:hypothetical protein
VWQPDKHVYEDALEWARAKIAEKRKRREYTKEAERLRGG